MDLDQRHNRAIELLNRHGYKVEAVGSSAVNLYDKDCNPAAKTLSLAELCEFVATRYPDEWREVERDYRQRISGSSV